MAQLKDLIVAGDAQILGDLNANSFSGTNGTTAGKIGLVPAPTTSDTNKYLKSDGTWAAVSSGSSDYSSLTNKPSINSTTLSGNKTSNDLNLQTKIYTDLTEDLYFVDGTAPTLPSGMYYSAGHSVYINGTKQNILTNNPFYFTVDEVDVGEDQWETYYTLGCVIGTTLYLATCSTDNSLIWTTKMDSVLKRTDIDTSIPSVSKDIRVPSTKLFATQLATKQNTLSQGTNITISGNTISATDTKNTAGSTDTSNRIYLIGATSQAANPRTYSDNEVFVKDGVLNAQELTIGSRRGSNSTIGANSGVIGTYNIASGDGSCAEGILTTASGYNSHAEGGQTIASASYSHAEGLSSVATGNYSHAEGCFTVANNAGAHAENGYNTQRAVIITGDANVTTYTTTNTNGAKVGQYLKYENEIRKITALVENTSITIETTFSNNQITSQPAYLMSTTASGQNSHAEGKDTLASGTCSHAEGVDTQATETNSHAEGNGSIASGTSSHAEGANTTASGEASHAEGNNTIASNNYAHAEGNKTLALGEGSHAEGICSYASGMGSHAGGACPDIEEEDMVYIALTGDANATTYTTTNTSDVKIGSYIKMPDFRRWSVYYWYCY